MITLTYADPSDAYELQLREEDAREVSPGWRQAVALSALEGNAQSARDGQGRLVALGGLDFTGHGEAMPWLLCSPLVEQHRATLWRTSRRFVRHMLRPVQRSGYHVVNIIPKDSTSNRRFVERLGLRIVPTVGDGPDIFYLPPNV